MDRDEIMRIVNVSKLFSFSVDAGEVSCSLFAGLCVSVIMV